MLQYNLRENRLVETKALIDNLRTTNANTDIPQNSYLKTLFARASKQTEKFNRLAQRTFDAAKSKITP